MATMAPKVAEEKIVESGSNVKSGLKLERYFTTAGASPYDEVEWEIRTAAIVNEKGKVVFEQSNVEIPKSWSQMATNVVASKYFRGPLGSPQREHSIRQLIGRVVDTVAAWGRADGYFAGDEDAQIFSDELTHILLHQKACFNSPVWFNCGIEKKPQCSACFILSVEDTSSRWRIRWNRSLIGIARRGLSLKGVQVPASIFPESVHLKNSWREVVPLPDRSPS